MTARRVQGVDGDEGKLIYFILDDGVSVSFIRGLFLMTVCLSLSSGVPHLDFDAFGLWSSRL
jgi:hypothetical protein